MKRIITLLILCMLGISLIGCSNSDINSKNATNTSNVKGQNSDKKTYCDDDFIKDIYDLTNDSESDEYSTSFKGKELKKRVEKALEFTGLMEYKDKKAEQFSGGMLRRLHLACAIAHTPKLIIMDEPTVGIDPQSRNHILQSVKYLKNNGASIIYTSHYMEEVEEICDEICIIDRGKIIAQGRADDIKSNLVKYNIYTIILKNEIEGIEKHIKKINGVKDVIIKENEIKCSYYKDVNILQKLVNTIFNNGGVIESIKDELPTLETVFLDLTGKKLRDWDKEEKIDFINFNKKGDNTIF